MVDHNIGKAHLEGFGSIEGVAKARVSFSPYWPHITHFFANAGNDLIRRMITPEKKNMVLYNSRDTFGLKKRIRLVSGTGDS